MSMPLHEQFAAAYSAFCQQKGEACMTQSLPRRSLTITTSADSLLCSVSIHDSDRISGICHVLQASFLSSGATAEGLTLSSTDCGD